MRNANFNCYILGHRNIGENDKLVFLYTEELGKIKAIARGARKITSKFMGHLEKLNYCRVNIYFGQKRTLLKEIETITPITNNEGRKDLNLVTNALEIAEITDSMLYEEQRIPGLLSLLNETVQFLQYSQKKDLIKLGYTVKLLDKIGLMPDPRNSELKTEKKYLKFLQYSLTENYLNINNIKLSDSEKHEVTTLLKELALQT